VYRSTRRCRKRCARSDATRARRTTCCSPKRAASRPKIAVLDEIDSGLDIDALRAVARRVEAATKETDLGVLAITHYRRLLAELHPDRVYVLRAGRIAARGGPELADELERTGYEGYDDNASE
jgi:Fe-S cluster assembly ATP-binding protein